jgi:ATP-dependent DNA helicase DinG
MIPEYDVVVVDEAHELSARVTQAATDELSIPAIERAAKRARNFLDEGEADELEDAADALRAALDDLDPGRIDALPEALAAALTLVRNAARAAFSGFPKATSDMEADAARQQARGMVDEVRQITERLVAHSEHDVVWLAERDRSRGGNQLCVAPLQVWGPLRATLLSEKTVILTSATLKLGGDFTSIATSIGLKPSDRVDVGEAGPDLSAQAAVLVDDAQAAASAADLAEHIGAGGDDDGRASGDGRGEDVDEGGVPEALPWRGIDVGSPFDYRAQSILYVARGLPAPGRDGIGPRQIEVIQALVEAAKGRTLGLFSSRRAAEAAAEAMREAAPHMPVLCQGDGQLSHLQAEFVANPAVSLFGTLSLWQGLDVPGETCQLVIIDRIPFPRPDDPLMSARARAAERAGGNGFMAVSATHAALLLAQGTGRLIRTKADRGVVAVLDSRLATARYGSFLQASLPPMWRTYDREVALGALRRLAG